MYIFSLVIPSYNISNFSDRFFKSLEHISEEVEVIFVNDCSTDNTKALIEKFIKTKTHMRLINHKVNKGVGGALNTGIKSMTTNWYFRLDPDDVILPPFLKYIKRAIIANPNAKLIRYKFMYRTEQKTFKPFFIERIYFKMAFGWSCGINVEKFGTPNFKEHFKMEDMEMFGRQYRKTTETEVFINKFLVEYTVDRNESIMNNIDESTFRDWTLAFENFSGNKDISSLRQNLYKLYIKRKLKKYKKHF